ncbi:hypothetical protein CLU79DRAFT_716531 [Phycomyces nitens]|nr:hypothetical protein CLU79DRAFT_716531 [Phycomyces nitens]
MSSKFICAITNVDSLVGYAVAHRFLKESQKSGEEHEIRLLCRSSEGLEDLKERGAKICEVNYSNENEVREALKDVRAVLFVPEHSKEFKSQGENVLRVSRDQKVKCLIMTSVVGVDKVAENRNSEKFRRLQELRQLEQKVQEHGGEGQWTIVRLTILTQLFFYLSPMIQNNNRLGLPIHKNCKWSAIDLQDAIDGIYAIAEKHRKNQSAGTQDVMNFTATKTWTGEEVAKSIQKDLSLDNEVQYEKIDENDFRNYLEKIRDNNNFKNPESDGVHRKGNADEPYNFPLARYLNQGTIECIIEILQLANEGHSDVVCKDLKELIRREPQDIHKFMQNNRDQFRRLK